ncbi:MAG: hypothetical protein PHY47_00770 [Lachnospiraceae bacterium]|nr:hypothetical protein [Lachnospiraceae bacterium]
MKKENIRNVFQIKQIKKDPPKYQPKAKTYIGIGPAKVFMTKWHQHALQSKANVRKDHSDYNYWNQENPWLDLNNFIIVEYELVEKTRHKHPLAK